MSDNLHEGRSMSYTGQERPVYRADGERAHREPSTQLQPKPTPAMLKAAVERTATILQIIEDLESELLTIKATIGLKAKL